MGAESARGSVRLGRRAKLTPADVERVRQGPDAEGWTPRQRALLRAADELHESRDIGEAAWGPLREHLDDTRTIELCMLVGHYEMLAMTINALGIQPDH